MLDNFDHHARLTRTILSARGFKLTRAVLDI